jgi:hypothetical protein
MVIKPILCISGIYFILCIHLLFKKYGRLNRDVSFRGFVTHVRYTPVTCQAEII